MNSLLEYLVLTTMWKTEDMINTYLNPPWAWIISCTISVLLDCQKPDSEGSALATAAP